MREKFFCIKDYHSNSIYNKSFKKGREYDVFNEFNYNLDNDRYPNGSIYVYYNGNIHEEMRKQDFKKHFASPQQWKQINRQNKIKSILN